MPNEIPWIPSKQVFTSLNNSLTLLSQLWVKSNDGSRTEYIWEPNAQLQEPWWVLITVKDKAAVGCPFPMWSHVHRTSEYIGSIPGKRKEKWCALVASALGWQQSGDKSALLLHHSFILWTWASYVNFLCFNIFLYKNRAEYTSLYNLQDLGENEKLRKFAKIGKHLLTFLVWDFCFSCSLTSFHLLVGALQLGINPSQKGPYSGRITILPFLFLPYLRMPCSSTILSICIHHRISSALEGP